MSRTNVDIDDEACAEVMRRYRLKTKREAVNFALRALAAQPLGIDEARRLRGSGWDGDLDEMRAGLGGDFRLKTNQAFSRAGTSGLAPTRGQGYCSKRILPRQRIANPGSFDSRHKKL